MEKYILEREKIRAQLEKEQEMGRAKELFLARMSHELRTPINGILGISQLAHYKDAEVREDFKKIRYQAEYLWELVNDVLDMAAIDNGKMTIRHVAFSLNEVVSEVSSLFYSQCRMKRIYFYFRVDNVTHEYLIGDAIRVKQVLVNLLSNSFKFTEKGGTIEVCMSELDVDDSRTVLHITVRDTGCGISDKALEKIWERLSRNSMKTENITVAAVWDFQSQRALSNRCTERSMWHPNIMWVQNSSWTFHLKLEKVLCGRNVSSDH